MDFTEIDYYDITIGSKKDKSFMYHLKFIIYH